VQYAEFGRGAARDGNTVARFLDLENVTRVIYMQGHALGSMESIAGRCWTLESAD